MFPSPKPPGLPLGHDWLALKEAVERFEGAWRQGHRPVIDEYLPAGDSLRHRVLIELVHVDLELRLKAGEAARVEEYLIRYPELARDRATAVGLIAAEYELRRRGEPHLSVDDLVQRFPLYRPELRQQVAQPTIARGGSERHAPPSQASSFPQTPPEVAGYEILAPLGCGGMGIVYKARQQSLDRPVALKFLPVECAQDPVWLGRFHREARTASALNHPHICTIYDTGACAGRPFFSMEFIEGRTLRAVTRERPPVERLAQLVGQVAKALGAAHAAGVVHRDIKPENLMVRDDGIVKVLDFGLARYLPGKSAAGLTFGDSGTDPNIRVGTLLYMSPEQARGEPAGTATDIFSLGLVLYELATGQHPFPADSELGVLQAIIAQVEVSARRLNPEIPASLEALIQQMLAKDPQLRPTAADVDVALAELAANRVGRSGEPSPGPGKHPTVGREPEREALRAGFESAVAGRGLFICVTGEPGLGKTTLVEDFLVELAAAGRLHSIAKGRCSERLAGTEAYLPFLEALDSVLRGDDGPAAARVMRLVAPAWYAQVSPSVADASPAEGRAGTTRASQERLKRELGVFFHELSRLRPLVLFLDDVHWADPSSADLLGYLGGRCLGLRLLIVLTYRPSELVRCQHPFGALQLELQARGVCREIALPLLNRMDLDRYLVLAFGEHVFPEEFPAAIYAKTGGNPLFMVDLLRYLCERSVIVRDQGRWTLSQGMLDMRRDLPESVRSMIQRKIGQLSKGDRRLLMAASVLGSEFDAAVVAQMLSRDAADVEERLEVLERIHTLVRLVGEQVFPDGTLTLRYGFVHGLYQNALYDSLQPTRKASWSAAAAQALLGHYGEEDRAAAGELALLFDAARDFSRAADYFLRAAENAVRVSAHREAIVLARRGLERLKSLPPTPAHAEKELPLQMVLGLQLQVTQGFAAPEAKHAYERARELCSQVGQPTPLYPVLWGLFIHHKARSELSKARDLAEELATLARERSDPDLTLQSDQAYAVTTLCLGEPAATRDHMERALTLYDPLRHRSHTFLFGQDVGVACKAFGAVALWLLGYPDQAARKSREAAALGHELSQPSSQVLALHFAAMLHQCRREPRAVLACADLSIAISAEQGFSFWHAGGTVLRGWALSECGSRAEGIVVLRQGLEAWMATGSVTYQTYYLALLAEVLANDGQTEEARKAVEEALGLAERTAERFFEAELHRLQGVLLLRAGESVELTRVEACFHQAVAVARRQDARSLDLRAVMSLCRLYQTQGRQAEARPMLEKTVGWFTEGFQSSDLQDAKALLKGLAP
jgi:predicted ATPase